MHNYTLLPVFNLNGEVTGFSAHRCGYKAPHAPQGTPARMRRAPYRRQRLFKGHRS